MNDCYADRSQQPNSRQHVEPSPRELLHESVLAGRTGMGQLGPGVSGTFGILTLAFQELLLWTHSDRNLD